MSRGRVENIQRDGKPVSPPKPGNMRALTHGASSERVVRRVATTQKRRLLRQIGLRVADLDGVGLAFLDSWARAQAKVELLDSHFDRVGFLDRRGKPRAAVAVYFTALNSARLAADRFTKHLRERGHGEDSMVVEMQPGRRT
jgi:hypothetical protein